MKLLVVLAVAVAYASADVSHVVKDEYHSPVVRSSYEIKPEGNFKYSYETGNGIYAESSGVLVDSEYPHLEVSGGFKYTSPEGEPIEVTYVADENGYRPQGSHLPVAPEIPEAIARSIEYIASHPPQPEPVKPVPARAG